MSYRISVDTGGTFTDVVIVDSAGELHIGKALTSQARAFDGIRQALEPPAEELGLTVEALLARTGHFAYGTTRATNAIVEGKTARTAFFTTSGFPDVLLLREGGKLGPFQPAPYPPPYVPRYLTFEIAERIDSDGDVFAPLDERSVLRAIEASREHGVEAIGVSLLWSIVNPRHELKVGELIAEHLPEATVTLSHLLNPIIREYRRASSTVIDASLKPLMQRYLGDLDDDLRAAGFAGRLLVSTSFGGSWPTDEMIERPIYSVGSGPSMAPVAGLACGRDELGEAPDLLVCDTGGTTFDVALISSGAIHHTAETWLGGRWTGHITGTKAVDVRSIGAGGGSIVSVDSGGLVHVGPKSAGAEPGPACYGLGGEQPTVTDAALILGYLEPDEFLGGRLRLDVGAAEAAFAGIAERLGKTVEEAAQGAMVIATQNVVSAIREITIAQGIDPRGLTIVAGGGASGLNVVRIARELGASRIILPRTAGALSASGALQADIISEYGVSRFAETRQLDREAVNLALEDAERRADEFLGGVSALEPRRMWKDATVEARYPGQVWELETPLDATRIRGDEDVAALEERFHDMHERVFAVREPEQFLECLQWKVRATAELGSPPLRPVASQQTGGAEPLVTRRVVFTEHGGCETPVYAGERLADGTELAGPAVILEPTTTVVVDPGARVRVSEHGNYLIHADAGAGAPPPTAAGRPEEAIAR